MQKILSQVTAALFAFSRQRSIRSPRQQSNGGNMDIHNAMAILGTATSWAAARAPRRKGLQLREVQRLLPLPRPPPQRQRAPWRPRQPTHVESRVLSSGATG